ncbi:MAG: hypothetical protein IPG80_03455 [Anaerolineales bacterium]|uniref:hypothetical protein n=1 Tax=Candidatus Villigracilis vicinus TaxID=3140679 RepID=UPI00313701C9|nr:hypothetical protein [Anaerolineales bacterium]
MTSAAALQEFGFAAYHNFEGESVLWYAIPTGGKLYPYYTDLIYSGSTDPIEALFEKTDIDRIYVVIHTYWPWSTDFIDQLKVECEQYQLIQRDIHLFEFVRYAEGNQNESDN